MLEPTHPASATVDPGVAVLRWPSEEVLRQQLAWFGLPRILVLDAGVHPPTPVDELEDWLRVPVDPVDLAARSHSVRRRAAGPIHSSPLVDDDGLLWVGRTWASLTPAQAPVVRLLLDNLERVVRFDAVVDTYMTAGGSAHAASVRTMLLRLTARLRPVGLELLTIRRRGVLLTWATPAGSVSRATGAA